MYIIPKKTKNKIGDKMKYIKKINISDLITIKEIKNINKSKKTKQ